MGLFYHAAPRAHAALHFLAGGGTGSSLWRSARVPTRGFAKIGAAVLSVSVAMR